MTTRNDSGGRRSKDILKILLATDLHVGFGFGDPIRMNDSFESLEEVLKLAIENEVDFVLLGGDLFHENRPSRNVLNRVLEILRRYCLGDRPIQFQVVSDQSKSFHGRFNHVNFEDPNYNIGLPIFTVHGNHDDPSGEGALSVMDLLSTTNLVNYFGKVTKVDDITLQPLLLKKGITKLALYGLGYVRDERLSRSFQNGKVTALRPEEDPDSWFNVMVLHQNRVHHNPKQFIRESNVPAFVDFLVWAHEHECKIIPEETAEGIHISQPGSTVGTSLIEGEAKKKHAALLFLKGNQFKLEPLPLRTVRPMVVKNVNLHTIFEGKPLPQASMDSKIEEVLEKEVEEAIEEAKKDYSPPANTEDTPDRAAMVAQASMLPLIRIKVDYTGYSTLHVPRFGQKYVGRVANPHDLLLFQKQRVSQAKERGFGQNRQIVEEPETIESFQFEDLIGQYLSESKALEILPEHDFTMAVTQYAEKDETRAIEYFVEKVLKDTQKHLFAAGNTNDVRDREKAEEAIQKAINRRTEERRAAVLATHTQPQTAATTTTAANPVRPVSRANQPVEPPAPNFDSSDEDMVAEDDLMDGPADRRTGPPVEIENAAASRPPPKRTKIDQLFSVRPEVQQSDSEVEEPVEIEEPAPKKRGRAAAKLTSARVTTKRARTTRSQSSDLNNTMPESSYVDATPQPPAKSSRRAPRRRAR